MFKKIVYLILIGFGIWSGFAFHQAALAEPSEKIIDVRYPKCPVSGNPVQDDFSVVHEKKLYRFCSSVCIETFYEDSKAVIAKIKDSKKAPLSITNFEGELPIKCLITGEPAVKRVFQIRGDLITFFCCPNCREKEKKSDAMKTPGNIEKKAL